MNFASANTAFAASPAPTPTPARALALRPITMAAAILCGGWFNVQAQSLQGNEQQLPSIEVTATGIGLGAGDMAAPVSVLEAEVWQQKRGATLGESLDGEPGIHASHFGAGASRPVIRGMEGPRVGVLANGAQ